GGTGQAAVSRAALTPPRVRVGLRAGRRLGRAPVRKGGGRGFRSPPRRTGYAPRVPALQAPPHLPHQEAEQHDAGPLLPCQLSFCLKLFWPATPWFASVDSGLVMLGASRCCSARGSPTGPCSSRSTLSLYKQKQL
uniref:Uncharacterized protein n=1 Tax=Aegilops tauschii subsp. strangulata TaxID=200361 RepID=A0A453QNM4_AEGTS